MPAFLPIVSKFDAKGINSAETSLKKFGKIAGGIAAAATAAVAGIAVASVKSFVDFDAALTKSRAIMGDLSQAMTDDMSDAARQVAKTTTFSAEQAAESFFFLASAGLDAEQSVAALPQVAKFAQAGMFDMATATDLATDAQSALGLASDDAEENLAGLTRVTDVFVAANTLANTSVEQLAAAFTSKAGTALQTVGKSVEEGAAALAVFADQGIKGERAGTLLTNAIFGLDKAAASNADEMKALGIEVFNSEGEMKNFADIARDFEGAMGDMSTEQKLATLNQLGFTKQSREGLLALMGNSDALAEYEAALQDAGGTAEEIAQKQLQTPAAQFALMKSAIEDVAISIGETMAPALGNLAGSFGFIVGEVGPTIVAFFENTLGPAIGFVAEKISDIALQLSEGEGFGDAFIRQFDGIGEAIGNFFSGGGFEDLLQKFIEVRDDLVNAFIEVAPGIIIALVEFIPEIVKTLLDMVPTLLETGVTTFMALIDAMLEILPVLLETILGVLPDLMETIISLLPSIIDAGIELFLGLVDAVIKVVPDLLSAILAALPDIIESLISMLPDIIDAGFELFTGIVTGIIEAMPDIIEATIDLIPEIVTAIIDSLPQIRDAGVEIVKGLVEGIVDKGPELLGAAIRGVANNIKATFESVMGISSPSKVFAGYGDDIVNGLKTGLDDGQRVLKASSLNMASSVMIAAEDGFVGSGISSMSSQGNNSSATFNITINAGVGSDPVTIGRFVTDAIKRYESVSGKVFASA